MVHMQLIAFVMQSRLLACGLLACVACGGLLAGVVRCGLLDYWWWTTDHRWSTEQSIGKLSVEVLIAYIVISVNPH